MVNRSPCVTSKSTMLPTELSGLACPPYDSYLVSQSERRATAWNLKEEKQTGENPREKKITLLSVRASGPGSEVAGPRISTPWDCFCFTLDSQAADPLCRGRRPNEAGCLWSLTSGQRLKSLPMRQDQSVTESEHAVNWPARCRWY